MVRLALIGCCRAGRRYAQVASRLHNATFVATVDVDPDTARRTAEVVGASVSCGGLDELLTDHGGLVDAVIMARAGGSRQRDCRQAAQAGKHLLVETPLALSAGASQDIITDCADAGVRLMVGQAMRYLPSVRTVKAELDSGRLGKPGLLRIHRWEPTGDATGDDPMSDLKQNAGTLHSQPLHEIDLACWLFGCLPTQLHAVGRRRAEPPTDELDYVQLHLGFPDGGMALIDYWRSLPVGKNYYSLSLIGSTGAAYADDHHNMQLLYCGGQPVGLATGQGDNHLCEQLTEFVAAIEENRQPLITGADGRMAVQVAEAAVESIAAGGAARLTAERYELVA